MAITAAAKKAIKRSRFLRERNLTFKIAMKKAIKAVKKSVSEWAKASEMMPLLQKAYSTIDKAQQKNILHKNNAARKKSRLNNMVKLAS